MRVLRILLQVAFGLLAVIVGASLLSAPKGSYGPLLVFLALIVLVILVLGPWWPNEENMARWSQKQKLDLPTDDPKVARRILSFLGVAVCLFMAWAHYTNPAAELWRIEKTIHAIAGTNGVVAFWVFLAFGGLASGVSASAKARKV